MYIGLVPPNEVCCVAPGVETFGLIGRLLGPLVMALAISTLRIYVAETKGRRTEGEARR